MGNTVVVVEHDEDQTLQKLIINFETLENVFVDDNLVGDTKRLVFENLTRLNTEYRKLHNAIGDRALPEIEFSSFGDELFKLRKNKQSWIKKQ
jgi:hypothetical protein